MTASLARKVSRYRDAQGMLMAGRRRRDAAVAQDDGQVDGGPMMVIVRRMDKIRDEFIDELFEMMKSEIQGLNYDTRMIELWRASITENFVAAIHYLARDEPTSLIEAPAAALAYARAAAQRDIPLTPLVRAHRLGHARFQEVAMQFASVLQPAEQTPTIIGLINRGNRLIDLVADQLVSAYEEEHDRWLSRRSGLQQQWVSEVLADKPIDIARAEKGLRYRFDGRHVAAVMWVDEVVPAPDVVALFDQVRSLLVAELGSLKGSLMVPTDDHEARLWFSPTRNLDTSYLRSVVESAGIPVRLAFGRVEEGLHGFRTSLKQAERVKAVSIAGAGRARERAVFFRDLAPMALMAGDVDELRRFVSDVLGDLSVDDERNEWLRETLRVFLTRNRSFVATAEAMILHRNTIQYRVTQAMELCGQTFDDPDAVFNVQVALEVCRWMAPGVLRPAKQQNLR
jgi:DNA-binding PucR family transcriptional regulator